MADEIPEAIYDVLQDEAESSQDDSDGVLNVSSILDQLQNEPSGESTRPSLSKEEIKLQILESCSNNANNIYQLITDEEIEKIDWRKFFIRFFSILLISSLVATITLIVLNAISVLHISDSIIICLFTYVIANIFTVLYFMVRYINNSQYLEMFKTVTHKMLEYLVQDKE